jgi:hypothetical protein
LHFSLSLPFGGQFHLGDLLLLFYSWFYFDDPAIVVNRSSILNAKTKQQGWSYDCACLRYALNLRGWQCSRLSGQIGVSTCFWLGRCWCVARKVGIIMDLIRIESSVHHKSVIWLGGAVAMVLL